MTCIYRHIRPDTNEVFYIGIGSIKRAYATRCRNNYWRNIVALNKNNYRIDIILDNLDRDDACKKEVEFIKLYGRSDLKQGTLCNLTDGGEKNLGRVVTEDLRERLSKANPKIWLGKKRPDCSARLAKRNKERVWTKEQRENHSKNRLGEKGSMYGKFGKECPNSKSIVCITTGITYESASDAAKNLGLNIGHIASVARGSMLATGHKKYPGGLQFKYLTN